MFDFQRYTRFLPKLIFESSRSPSKVWVLAQSQSTMLRRITHMTMLSVVICVMSVWNQTSQAFVTCSCPYSDWLSKFVDRPQNVWSSNSCHVQACQDNLWANFWQFSTDSRSSCLTAWIDDRPNKDAKLCIVRFFCLPIRSTDQHIFEYVIPCRGSTMKFWRSVCPILAISQLLQQIYLTQISLWTVQ